MKKSKALALSMISISSGFQWQFSFFRVWEVVGTSEGFIGCVHSLRVGRRLIEFDVGRDPLIRAISKVFACPVINLSNQVGARTIMDSFNEPPAQEEGVEGEDFGNQISPVITTALTGSSSLVSFKINPCLRWNPCQNHGLCWVDMSSRSSSRGYKCICHPEFSGELLSL